MTTTVNYLSVLLNQGKLALAEAAVQGKKLRPHSYVIGDAYNFTPSEDGTTVTGNVGYTADARQIAGSILAQDTFRFVITVPDTAGGFTVGNIMLYLEADDGTVFPFLWYVSKVPYPKDVLSGAGSYLLISFIEKIINANDALNLTIIPPGFFSLVGYPTEASVPAPNVAFFQQFVIQDPTYSPTPILAARRTLDNRYWGTPLFSRLDEPDFGKLDGGRAAEWRNQPYRGRYFWAGKLGMQPGDLPFNYGGAKLSDDPIIYNIGGEPLPPFRGYTGYYDFLTGEFIWGGRLKFPQEYYLTNCGGLKLTDSPENTFGGIPLSQTSVTSSYPDGGIFDND